MNEFIYLGRHSTTEPRSHFLLCVLVISAGWPQTHSAAQASLDLRPPCINFPSSWDSSPGPLGLAMATFPTSSLFRWMNSFLWSLQTVLPLSFHAIVWTADCLPFVTWLLVGFGLCCGPMSNWTEPLVRESGFTFTWLGWIIESLVDCGQESRPLGEEMGPEGGWAFPSPEVSGFAVACDVSGFYL